MSRVGKLPIIIPDSVKVETKNNLISFSSGVIKKSYKCNPKVKIEIVDGRIKLSSSEKDKSESSMFIGMDRSNIKNIIIGLSAGFKCVLEINGVGYKASVDKSVVILTLGYSHEIYYALPFGVSATFEKPNLIVINGSDNIMVGQVASEIMSFRKPEPYKGKGVKLMGKKILRKEGKKK